MGPETLAQVLGKLPKPADENLLVGISTSDDAAVYRISSDLALIQTVDFFTPVVDDPYLFGQIAAANALSDVYAMGGVPRLALNIVGFPNTLDPSILEEILTGGSDKVKEADVVLAGGHSVQNDEPQYGLCVSGLVHPDRIWKNSGAQPGDVLLLTKPVGSGLVNTAAKAGMVSDGTLEAAISVMRTLNRSASEAAVSAGLAVHACTDVTGFGLLGHGREMADASCVTLEINTRRIPLIPDALDFARMGLVPAGSYRNRKFAGERVASAGIDEAVLDALYDPQTSGGLLFSLPEEAAMALQRALRSIGYAFPCAVIGSVLPRGEKSIVLS